MTSAGVIYEVNLSVEPGLEADFGEWLRGHAEEMLALPGFRDAKILRDQSETDSGRARFTVHYSLTDRAALERYFAEHAERMRAQAVTQFGDRFSATRRVLEKAAPGVARADLSCRNCHAPLSGQYCHVCGQRDKHRMISLYELIRDFVGDLFEFDSRVWRTLSPLLFRPGYLTLEYLRGRRVRYTPPLRLYLVLSIAFFVLASFDFDVGSGFRFEFDTDVAGEQGSVDAPVSGNLTGLTVEDCAKINVEDGLFGIDPATLEEFLRSACLRHGADPAQLIAAFRSHIPQMMFVFLPLIALVMKFLYLGSRRYYVEHLLFVVHVHSFAYLLLTLMMLFGRLPVRWAWQSAVAEVLSTVVSFYMLYYAFRAMRVVYGQGRAYTLIKYVLLMGSYFASLLVLLILGVLFTIAFG